MKLFHVKFAFLLCELSSLWFRPSLGFQQCSNSHPVGVSNTSIIRDVAMTASTAYRKSVDYLTARQARLHGTRAWCPSTVDGDDWLQVDLGFLYFVCGVVTQGKEMRIDEWVYNYTLTWSRDAVTWMNYTENDGQVKIFDGNKDGTSEVRNNFASKIWMRYLRIHPLGYKEWPCLRVEIYVELTPAVITRAPLRQSLAVGEKLLLDCVTEGSPQPEVTWTLNGNDIIFGKALSNGSLLVEKVENDNNFEGRYSCQAINRVSLVRSFADVIIHAKPEILNPLPLKSPYLRGKTAVLSCYATGDPVPKITWSKDGNSIPRKRIHSNGHVLILGHVTSQDVGVYRCIASNDLGNAVSVTNLTVIDFPTINTTLTRQTVYAVTGQQVNIGCYGESIIPLNYSWTKDGMPIMENYGNRVYGNLLVITPRGHEDYGTYMCHVANEVDSTSFSIKLSPLECGCDGSSVMQTSQQCVRNHLEIVLPLLFLVFISVAMNFYLVYRMCRMRKESTNQVPIQMSALQQQQPGSHLMKDTEIAWDNLIPEESYHEENHIGSEINLDEDGSRYHEDEGDEVQLVRSDAMS